MENFLNLPKEKQNTILDAAFAAFGANGYKKASIADVAAAAGISKAAVFHYFGTKKALYLYLLELCWNTMIDAVNEKFDNSITDFFGRILRAADIKIAIIRQHPAMLAFLTGVFFEADPEVKPEIEAFFAKGEGVRLSFTLDGLDASRFKDGVDPALVLKMLTWLSEGFVSGPPGSKPNLDTLEADFQACVRLLRNNLYKPEFLEL